MKTIDNATLETITGGNKAGVHGGCIPQGPRGPRGPRFPGTPDGRPPFQIPTENTPL